MEVSCGNCLCRLCGGGEMRYNTMMVVDETSPWVGQAGRE